MAVALIPAAVSCEYQLRLEQELGLLPTYLNVAELRRLPARELLRTLRSHGREPWFLAMEDPGAEPLLPVLQAVAAFSNPPEVEVVHSDLRREPVPAWRGRAAVARVAAASVLGRAAKRQCRRELRGLLGELRGDPQPATGSGVLYVNANLWFGVRVGGSVGHTAGVVNELARAGYTVDLASMSAPAMVGPDVRHVALQPPRSFGVPFEVNLYRTQRRVARQLGELAHGRHAFVYQRMSIANWAGVSVSRSVRRPLVLEYNGSEAWAAKHWGRPLADHDLAVQAEDVCLRHAHVVVTVSDVLRRELVGRGIEPERIVCHPNGVDPTVFDPEAFGDDARREVRRQLGIPADACVVTFVGTFGQWHGVDVLARVIDRLAREQPPWLAEHGVRFLLVGDGLKGPVVRGLLDEDERTRALCTLTGLVPQATAPRYLAASDVLVSPHVPNPDGTPFFGSPTKLFEYMAMGKGIVASCLDQIADVLAPGLDVEAAPDTPPGQADRHVAALVEPANHEQLREGIRFLVERPDWRASLGRNARKKVLAHYTWRHHVRPILDRVRELTGVNP